jgi:hypothetical protein
MVVFVIEALLLGVSLVLLRGIDVHAFRKQVEDQPNLIERAAMANDA